MEGLDLPSDNLDNVMANQCMDDTGLNSDDLKDEEDNVLPQSSELKNDKVKCPMCSHVLRLSNLEQHIKNKHQEKSHVCTQCDARFESQGYLLWHIRFTHTEHKYGHTCEVCSENFRLKQDLMAHYVSHKVAEGIVKCSACSQSFSNYAILRLHELMMCLYRVEERCESTANESSNQYYDQGNDTDNTEDLDDSNNACEDDNCQDDEDGIMNDILKKGNLNGNGLIDESNGMMSNRQNAAESAHRNNVRQTEFTSLMNEREDELEREELEREELENEVLEGEAFKSLDEQLLEDQDSTVYSCPFCNKVFPAKGPFTTHVNRHTKPFKCDICGRGFARVFAMETHKRTHSVVKENNCELCGWGFSQKRQLDKHIAEHHSEDQPLRCDMCGCRFQHQRALNRHVAQHCPQRIIQGSSEVATDLSMPKFSRLTSTKPSVQRKPKQKGFKCAECHQVLATAELFEEHQQAHSKRFPCKLCSIRFRERFLLQLHVYSAHFNIQPYKCVICGLRFNLKSHAETHGAQHLKTQSFVCAACGLMFRNEETRANHLNEGLCLGQRPERINVKAMIVFEKPDWGVVGISRSLMGYDVVDQTGIEDANSKDNNSTDNTDLQICEDNKCSMTSESAPQNVLATSLHTGITDDQHEILQPNTSTTPQRKSTRSKPKPSYISADISDEDMNESVSINRDIKIPAEDDDSNSIVTGSKAGKFEEPERGANGKIIYRCHICSKPNTKRVSLATHLARVHGVGGEPFRCFICGRGNVSELKMMQHFELHIPYRRHVCLICGERFSAYRNLRRHKRIGKCALSKFKPGGVGGTASRVDTSKVGQKKFTGNFMARLEDDGRFEMETDVLEVEYVDDSILDVYLANNQSTIKSEPDDYESGDESFDNSTDTKNLSTFGCKQDELNWSESLGIKQEIQDEDISNADDITSSSMKLISQSDTKPEDVAANNCRNFKNFNTVDKNDEISQSELGCNDTEPLNGIWNASLSTTDIKTEINSPLAEENTEDAGSKDGVSSDSFAELVNKKLMDLNSDKSALQLPLHVKILRSKSLPRMLKGILGSTGFNIEDIIGVSDTTGTQESLGSFDSGDIQVREVILINGVAYDEWFKKALDASRTGQKPAISGNKDIQEEYEQFEESKGWCLECNKRFPTKYRYRNHMQRHCEVKKFKCKHCKQEFKTAEERKEHERWHDPQHVLTCGVCDMEFVCSATLRQHMKCHSVEKSHKCDTCGRMFRRKYDLITHSSIHTGELPFKCPVCDKQFRLQPSLNDHMRLHNGNKPFECSICGKQFAQRGNWRTHERRHLGIKKYTCERCNKSFVQNYELQNHRLRCVTQDLPFSCLLCGMRFTLENPLKIHLERHSCRLCGLQFVDMKEKVTHQYKCRSEAKQRAKEAIKNGLDISEDNIALGISSNILDTSRKGKNSGSKSTNKRKSGWMPDGSKRAAKTMKMNLGDNDDSVNDYDSDGSPVRQPTIDYNIDVSRIKEELESDIDDNCEEFEGNDVNFEGDGSIILENTHDAITLSMMRAIYQHKNTDALDRSHASGVSNDSDKNHPSGVNNDLDIDHTIGLINDLDNHTSGVINDLDNQPSGVINDLDDDELTDVEDYDDNTDTAVII